MKSSSITEPAVLGNEKHWWLDNQRAQDKLHNDPNSPKELISWIMETSHVAFNAIYFNHDFDRDASNRKCSWSDFHTALNVLKEFVSQETNFNPEGFDGFANLQLEARNQWSKSGKLDSETKIQILKYQEKSFLPFLEKLTTFADMRMGSWGQEVISDGPHEELPLFFFGGKTCRLSETEWKLARCLYVREMTDYSKIESQVWDDGFGSESTIRSAVSRLNKKLKECEIPLRWHCKKGKVTCQRLG